MTDLTIDPTSDQAARRPAPSRTLTLSEYGLIGDMRTAALVGLDGGDRLVLPAALRQRQRVRRACSTRSAAAPGPSARRASGPPRSATCRAPTFSRPRSGPRTASSSVTDFMPVGRGRPTVRPASGDPPAAPLHPRPRGDAACSSCPGSSTGPEPPGSSCSGPVSSPPTGPTRCSRSRARSRSSGSSSSPAPPRGSTMEKGEERWLVLRYDDDDIHPGRPLRERPQARRSPPLSGAAGRRACATAGPSGDGQALRPGAQAADPRGDRSDHRRADDFATRDDRRRAELGLSVRMAPGRRVHARGARRGRPPSRRPTPSCASSRRCAGTRAAGTSRSCTASTAGATWSSGSSTT